MAEAFCNRYVVILHLFCLSESSVNALRNAVCWFLRPSWFLIFSRKHQICDLHLWLRYATYELVVLRSTLLPARSSDKSPHPPSTFLFSFSPAGPLADQRTQTNFRRHLSLCKTFHESSFGPFGSAWYPTFRAGERFRYRQLRFGRERSNAVGSFF